MTFEDFSGQWFKNTDPQKVLYLLVALDILYLEFKPMDAIELVGQYLNNADDIVNSFPPELQEKVDKLFAELKKE